MNDKERNELAADIARRVRLYAWQPLSQTMIDNLPEYSTYWRYSIGGGGYRDVSLAIRWTPTPSRLELEFIALNGETLQRLLWTP